VSARRGRGGEGCGRVEFWHKTVWSCRQSRGCGYERGEADGVGGSLCSSFVPLLLLLCHHAAPASCPRAMDTPAGTSLGSSAGAPNLGPPRAMVTIWWACVSSRQLAPRHHCRCARPPLTVHLGIAAAVAVAASRTRVTPKSTSIGGPSHRRQSTIFWAVTDRRALSSSSSCRRHKPKMNEKKRGCRIIGLSIKSTRTETDHGWY